MESFRTKSLSVPQLLLLLSFLISPLPSWSQAENLNCFVCSSETSPKCEEALSLSSDPELIQDCSTGNNSVAPSGCQIIIIQPGAHEYPKKSLSWRDCLYPSDLLASLNLTLPPIDDPWYSGRQFTEELYNIKTGRHILSRVNARRESLGLSGLPLKRYVWGGKLAIQYYVHPEGQHWNVSNGEAAKTLFPDMYKKLKRVTHRPLEDTDRSTPILMLIGGGILATVWSGVWVWSAIKTKGEDQVGPELPVDYDQSVGRSLSHLESNKSLAEIIWAKFSENRQEGS